ncbi:MAG: ATP-dependent DNA ligase [Pseudonocardia sp.]|nr:ATP-dependent DNA ligase [Pseudonocardia sp.]
MAERILPELADRPLSVMRVRLGQEPFMQKNLPRYAPDWITTTPVWSFASKREISYPVCHDQRTLLWFANQRAVEYHAPLFRIGAESPTYLVLDLDPPAGDSFGHVVAAAMAVRQALADCGIAGAVKTSGSKGVHVMVPLVDGTSGDDAAAATRALAARAERLDPAAGTTAYVKQDRAGKVFLDSTRAHGATVACAYSPRIRPGVPVSFPLDWAELGAVTPADFTVHTAVDRLGDGDPWHARMPAPQALPADLVEEGRAIPVARVVAMHEGKRRKRAAEQGGSSSP